MNENTTAFISYSWDDYEHKEWVLRLTSKLRKNGIDATADVFETQKGTVHLDSMMVENIMKNDYTVIVMTPNYAERANEMEGGVGTETRLLLNLIKDKSDKIIPILRMDTSDFTGIPFYLEGFYYIDFREDIKFNDKFKELLRRLYKIPEVELTPLGPVPVLTSRKLSEDDSLAISQSNDLPSLTIPNLRKITDKDKHTFIKESFEFLKEGLGKQLEITKNRNYNFDFDIDNITSLKTIYSLYVEGERKHSMKMWVGNNFGQSIDAINLSHGGFMSIDSDNSMNEFITCEIDDEKKLRLKMNMNFSNSQRLMGPNEVLNSIWEEMISKIMY